MTQLPPDPLDVALAILGQFGVPAVVVLAIATVGWLKDWIDAGRGAISGLQAASRAASSAPASFTRVVLVQSLFVALTILITRTLIAGMSLPESVLGASWAESSGILILSALLSPPGIWAWVAFSAASGYVLIANLAARYGVGLGPLGWLLSAVLVPVAIIAIVVVVARITSLHDEAEGVLPWAIGAVGVVTIFLWARLASLSADAPLDLRRAVGARYTSHKAMQ